MKYVWSILFIGFIIVSPLSALESSVKEDALFANVEGEQLNEAELDEIDGSLNIFGFRLFSRTKKTKPKHRQKASKPKDYHCDVLAHNRAAKLERDTRDQSGNYYDCNKETVQKIYERYPNNHHRTPPKNTSGYIFTSYHDNQKQHMQAYSRGNGSHYTRYSNNSFKESINKPKYNWKPTSPPGRDIFIPLPKLKPVYYR